MLSGLGGISAAYSELAVWSGVAGLFLFLSLVMVYGVKESARLAVFISLIELTGLLVIVYAGFPYIGTVNYFEAPDLAGLFEASA